MGKLLAWGDELFLVRCELGKIQLQRVSVDAERKKASLHLCSIKDDEVAALPVDASLVAAKEVEDTELAIRYPILVFRAPGKTVTINSSSASRKRRRSLKDKAAFTSNDESMLPRAGDCLLFCILYETESDGEIGVRILNMLDTPIRVEESEDITCGDDSYSLQLFPTDGPYVLLFRRNAQVATVLKLQRTTQQSGDLGFHVWYEKVEMFGVEGDASVPFELLSCKWLLCEDNATQQHVICVRCDDTNRSFFMLRFSSNVPSASMDLLLSFNHVGHAYPGNFAADISGSRQVLLVNGVPGVLNTSADCANAVDDGQLIKRSVLVTQKPSASDVKLSCHRLRLQEDPKSNQASRSRKRSRNSEKGTGKDAPSRSTPESFHYIQRTHKASSRDVNQLDTETDSQANVVAASALQLGKLVSSLTARLSKGLLELGRLQMIVGDKNMLARQLNQLIIRQWQKQQTSASHSKEQTLLTPLRLTQEAGSLATGSKELVEMETIVSAPPRADTITRNAVKSEALEYNRSDFKLEQQVSLEQFRVLGYVPSSSRIHAEVSLKNLSDSRLDDAFVVLTAPEWTLSQGWSCTSSVIPEFPPTTDMDHTAGSARFHLEIQFKPTFSFLRERRPLEVMLWLHWSASRDKGLSMALDWRPSESALAVASIKIHPADVLAASREAWTKDQERLLFVSSGSNLKSLFSNPKFGIFTSPDSIIRPTFSLVDLKVNSSELFQYELSQMVAKTPPDVYVMRNPLQHSHLRTLQCLLISMRQELEQKDKLVGNYKTQRATFKGQDSASMHRSIQRDTDLHAVRLLQELQQRVNFHSMWFDTSTRS
ncbi:uncharacterized protein PITG_12147 [Phytophthora infestans T30-4]|uniref:Uncharacterized protein n=1 Tax=Phytophthora infestans (strain T30-4) TaxID=403677 RepID=D0NJ56_PHYIT|nr:uncharacterized protein PITG_12147 [Phytophthora infestans T30-4]EEY59574.1 hypothetical protein PITG_12147 [Phytophthora infestans T30-4]|eukprot:XP_002900767.1 hypothetical protein PITG_12147 [Phytophthora infestans T30-4]